MGRPHCWIPHCVKPLQNNWHRFCDEHTTFHNKCAIIGCEEPVVMTLIPDLKGGAPKVKKKKACTLPLHQEMERKNHECSTGSFLYCQRLQHANVSQPVDSFSHTRAVPEQDIQKDIETYDVGDKNTVQFNVKKTHIWSSYEGRCLEFTVGQIYAITRIRTTSTRPTNNVHLITRLLVTGCCLRLPLPFMTALDNLYLTTRVRITMCYAHLLLLLDTLLAQWLPDCSHINTRSWGSLSCSFEMFIKILAFNVLASK